MQQLCDMLQNAPRIQISLNYIGNGIIHWCLIDMKVKNEILKLCKTNFLVGPLEKKCTSTRFGIVILFRQSVLEYHVDCILCQSILQQ